VFVEAEVRDDGLQVEHYCGATRVLLALVDGLRGLEYA
jgi:hypothetical protein